MAKKSKTVANNIRLNFLNNQIKALKVVNARISKANKDFKKMSAAAKRIAIAKDVLAQLSSQKYIARTGKYAELDLNPVLREYDEYATKEVKDQIAAEKSKELFEVIDAMPKCECCARGALFLSACCKFNNLTVGDILSTGSSDNDAPEIESDGSVDLNSNHLDAYEEKFFSANQLGLIESMFEAREMGNKEFSKLSEKRGDPAAAGRYGQAFESETDRLAEAMKNLIKNNGKFVIPEQYYL